MRVPSKRVSEEVLYAVAPSVEVGGHDIGHLKVEATRTARRRVRLCAHGDVADSLHEMFIVHERGTYVRPHKHMGKSESLHVIEGSLDLVLFDDEGAITGAIRMGEYRSGNSFFHRISEPTYHTMLITSDVVVFHETTGGPFDRSDTIFASWSPPDDDNDAVKGFMERLEREAGIFAGPRHEDSTLR